MLTLYTETPVNSVARRSPSSVTSTARMPTAGGILAVLVTLLGLRLATLFTGVSVYSVNISTGLGLGLAIDYSLLFVYRYREELAARRGDVEAALGATLATAG